MKMGDELWIYHLVNHRETTKVRHAEQLLDNLRSLPIRAPLQGMIMVQRPSHCL